MMAAAIESGTDLGVEAAKPVYRAAAKALQAQRDMRYFLVTTYLACLRAGLSQEKARRVRKAVKSELRALQQESAKRLGRAGWGPRLNLGPGIDGLTTRKLKEFIDLLYQRAIEHHAIQDVPLSITVNFWEELGDGFEPGPPYGRKAYARRLLSTLDHNNRQYLRYLEAMAAITGNASAPGTLLKSP